MAIKTQSIDIYIYQGATFVKTFIAKDENGNVVDLSGYTGAAQLRKHPGADNAWDFTVTIPGSPAGSNVEISMRPELSRTIPPGKYVYDVRLDEGTSSPLTSVSRLTGGLAIVSASVTKTPSGSPSG